MKKHLFLVLMVAACGPNIIPVAPGGSIQAAVDQAKDGDIIEVQPGTYKESVDLPRERQFKRLTLRGMIVGTARAILDGENTRQNGIFAADVTELTIEGFQVQNYTENGVWVGTSENGQSTDVVFRNLVVDSAGRYGIFPLGVTNALVEQNTVTRVRDAGIYVGQSTGNLIIQDNEVANNVAGIECENSDDCIIRRNRSHDNTGGILVFTLPGLKRKQCRRAQVYENTIENNNTPNFASPSDVVANVPAGGGLTIIGADDANIYSNTIRGNQSYAAAIVSLTLLTGSDPIDVDPTPTGNRIHDNTLTNNGTAMSFTFQGQTLPAGDFAYDASDASNCQANNGIAQPRWVLAPLPTCQ